MEWVILDDSPMPWEEAAALMQKDPRVRYVHESGVRRKIAEKRNMLNELGKGDIFIAFDDDDIQHPDRVKESVMKLMRADSQYEVLGATELLIYDVKLKQGYMVGPYAPIQSAKMQGGIVKVSSHATNGTFAYRRSYLQEHAYVVDPSRNTGEEKPFLKDFTVPILQLDPYKSIICVNWNTADGGNTFNKQNILRENHHRHFKLKQLVKDKKVFDFYTKTLASKAI